MSVTEMAADGRAQALVEEAGSLAAHFWRF